MLKIILALALSLAPPWYRPGTNPETPEAYRSRVTTIATAIADESAEAAADNWGYDERALAVLMLRHSYNESRFRLDIHAGTTFGDSGRASCLAQIHASRIIPKPEWEGLVGTDLQSTRRCYHAMVRVLKSNRWGCARGLPFGAPAVAAILSGYRTGSSCREKRARLFAPAVMALYARAWSFGGDS